MKYLLYILGVANYKTKSIERLHEQKSGISILYLNISFVLILITMFTTLYILYSFGKPINRPILELNTKNGQIRDLITLDYPQQNYNSLETWVINAVVDLNSISFNKIEEDLERNRKYFLDDKAFSIYVSSLENNKTIENIEKNSILMSSVTIKKPVKINEYGKGEDTYWLYRVPVLRSYITGSNNDTQEVIMVDVLIFRVPAYKNHKGLAISMIKMS